MADLSHLFAAARRAILDGNAASTGEARTRAYEGEGSPEAVGAYVRKVKERAYTITDEDVAALRAAGLDDDQIFELTVAAAIGQASRQYDAAVTALDAAVAARAKDGAA